MVKKLQYMRDRDQVVAELVTEDGTSLHTYRYICFGATRGGAWLTFLKTPKVKYTDFYFTSSLERLRKSKIPFIDKFMEALLPTGIFRNAEVSKIEWDDMPPNIKSVWSGYLGGINNEYWFKVRFDVDKVSSPEMFLIGNIFRCLHLHPYIIYDFLKLVRLHPEVCPFSLFMIAHTCRLNKNRPIALGHSIVGNSGLYIANDVNAVLKRLDEDFALNGSMRKAPYYSRLWWDSWLMPIVMSEHNQFSLRYCGTIYSPEILKTYLSKEDFEHGLETLPENELLYKPIVRSIW